MNEFTVWQQFGYEHASLTADGTGKTPNIFTDIKKAVERAVELQSHAGAVNESKSGVQGATMIRVLRGPGVSLAEPDLTVARQTLTSLNTGGIKAEPSKISKPTISFSA